MDSTALQHGRWAGRGWDMLAGTGSVHTATVLAPMLLSIVSEDLEGIGRYQL